MSFDLQAKVWNIDFIKPASHKYVLLCLAHRANKAGVCWPSIATISKDTGLSGYSALSDKDPGRRQLDFTRSTLRTEHSLHAQRAAYREWGVNTPTNFDRVPIPELIGVPLIKLLPHPSRIGR